MTVRIGDETTVEFLIELPLHLRQDSYDALTSNWKNLITLYMRQKSAPTSQNSKKVARRSLQTPVITTGTKVGLTGVVVNNTALVLSTTNILQTDLVYSTEF